MEEEKVILSAQKKSEQHLKEDSNYEDEAADDLIIFKARVNELELMRNELNEIIDQNKIKAQNLLIKKDYQIKKFKLIVQKYEYFLK